jgi:hypothetical protein
MSTSVEVADIFRLFGAAYRQVYGTQMPLRQWRAMRAIGVCRTAVLGGHVEACDVCGAVRNSYNSCRNRHCPKCQCLAKERWIEDRKQDLLPVPYFHVVFTLPEELRPLALRNQKAVYNLLFKAASETLLTLARDPKHLGAQIGFTAILHTWTQTLMDHPHLHCIVPCGGLSLDGKRWIAGSTRFFIPIQVLSALFRGKFLAHLKTAYKKDQLIFPGQIAPWEVASRFYTLIAQVRKKEWNVYCKPPFGSPEHVLKYLGRYTHRVAISNERILKLGGDQVIFRYRDSADGNRTKQMPLSALEFIRRFLLHILPEGFVKIRHYGILSNRNRKTKLRLARQILGIYVEQAQEEKPTWQDLLYRLTGVDPNLCPHCGTGRMVTREALFPQFNKSPPKEMIYA